MRAVHFAGMLALAGFGCGPSAPAVDAKAEEQAIRQLDDQWNAAMAKKDVEACVNFYASDGVAMWPNVTAAKRGPPREKPNPDGRPHGRGGIV